MLAMCSRLFFSHSACSSSAQKCSDAVKERIPFDLSLYLVTDRKSVGSESEFFSKIQKCVEGGVSCIQLRDPDDDFATSVKTALRLKEMLLGTPVTLMINNRIDVAIAARADGVYLEDRSSNDKARRLLGPRAIIGQAVHTVNDVLAAGSADIDYLSVKIFPSKRTNPNESEVWGTDGLKKVRFLSHHRIVAIGGIHLGNLSSVAKELHLGKTGDGIAMVGDLWRAEDPFATAKKIREALGELQLAQGEKS